MPIDQLSADELCNGQDDVAGEVDRFLRDNDERSEEKRGRPRKKTRGRKRQRQDSTGSLACCTALTTSKPSVTFPESPLARFDLPREDMNAAYSTWQKGQVSTNEHREHYTQLEKLLTDRYYDLDMVMCNKEGIYDLCIRKGVPEGIAWRWVSDAPAFLEYRAKVNSVQGQM
ncbi:hypothetical protein FSARC_10479 [Fusarium sarcochroum]|uniref:Uncharacterized protein n=1 Tax=Fusarium sarcochroum TaxID=1208366 RepID=A0A8H4X491_9HYPO|nr:hypothetical protein FSARC_10479 [Fusarium sarcochroum]